LRASHLSMVRMALARTGPLRRTPGQPIESAFPMRRPTDPEVDQICFQHRRPGSNRHLPQRSNRPRQQYPDRPHGRTACTFVFDRNVCETCPLFTRCVSQPNHRTHGNHLFLRSFPAEPHANASKPTSSNNSIACALASKASKPNWFRMACARPAMSENHKRRLQRLWLRFRSETCNACLRWPRSVEGDLNILLTPGQRGK